MTLRERQAALTRTAIVEAATDLIFGDGDPSAFTMQAVADAAGVSHRTLYRHFPSRQELINAVGAHFDSSLDPQAGVVDRGTTFEEWLGAMPGVVAFARTQVDMLKRTAVLKATTGEYRTDRDEQLWNVFRARFPNLPEAEAREDFATFRLATSAPVAHELGERFGLSAQAVADAMGRSMRALTDAIAARDEAAGKEAEAS